ncbi:MAG: NAD(P)/FAD-dependent oxidoreductase, partial [bacterium]
TGGKPRSFPGIEPNGNRIITSKEAMVLKQRPESMVILGAGAIGMEFAYFYHTFGTDVTVVEMMDRILPQEDPEISEELQAHYENDGMDIRTGVGAESVDQNNGVVNVSLQNGDELEADAALVALGLEPNTEDLWDPNLNLRTDDAGWIDVKDDYRTSLPGVYAIGDVIGAPWLAHVASHEGIKMVDAAFGDDEHYEPLDYESVPAGTFCQPQVASVGLTEEEARNRYENVKIGRFPFQAIGRAVAVGHTEGFVKLVFAGDYDELVGGHVLGENATELITELTLARNLEATPEEIFDTIHPHPTMSETLMEAALDAHDRSIHH